ncbi:PREDICTED: probable methyltransferase PMT27 [Tarenaya hassleriana]|uniref:probable methyltransferase PMT27 n=1 Tax=Tarenaya hassleriana TaxID=28532 RepID=UPI00053C0FF2|nr:PREDICTED: probable methyltransferase PMT27 [Tarenaya hassleriana]
MAVGKTRGNKRSATTSYASTVTTVIFVALCVIGVWMLSSNSVTPPQITRASTRTASVTESNEQQPVFEDNPGKLPDDAIMSDESKDKNEGSAAEVAEKQRQGEGSRQETEQKSEEDNEGDKEKENSEKEKGQVMKEEYEKEQREQREEDEGTQGQDVLEQGKKQGHDLDSSNSEVVTFTDSTRDEQPTEHGFLKGVSQNETSSDDAKNQENGQQQQEDPSSGREENVQEDEQNTTTDENGRTQQNTDNGQQQAEQSTVPEEEDGQTNKKQQEEEEEKGTDAGGASSGSGESFPGGGNSVIPKESPESKKSWKTQATESKNEKQRQRDELDSGESKLDVKAWELCNTTAGPDYIPCLDNEEAIMKLRSRRHFEHRERHCPEDPPTCLAPLPEGYKESIKWPDSRDKIWYHNVPHTKLAEVKGHQNWVKVTGEFLTFPGGGTQFIHGALHYIDFLQQSLKRIGWGKHTRVILDVGCGVASFGGYLFERDVLAMSLAPKDEHEAQVQFALERRIPAISAVMGSQRLPFPSRVFDLIHCARCRVPWHNEGGLLLLELNRLLRPGGYFVWSATPVYQKLEEDVQIWKEMSSLTKSMCWDLVTINKDKLNGVGAAIFRKPVSNECYEKRQQQQPPMCKNDDDANAAWYVPLQACMHKVPINPVERGSKWPVDWPRRLQAPPYWLNSSQMGIYGKPAPQDFTTDYEHWKQVVSKVYMNELGISWSNVRNVMDMRAVYGGFAAALRDLQVWVMNVVNINSPDTLPIIYERGLFGIYHDWCESFSTYPRSYDLLHADHLFSKLKERCKLAPVMAEVDRIVRPGGKFIVRDESNIVREVETLLKSLNWDVHLTFSKNREGILSAQKGFWRPDATQASS